VGGGEWGEKKRDYIVSGEGGGGGKVLLLLHGNGRCVPADKVVASLLQSRRPVMCFARHLEHRSIISFFFFSYSYNGIEREASAALRRGRNGTNERPLASFL